MKPREMEEQLFKKLSDFSKQLGLQLMCQKSMHNILG